jgi:GTP-binding protein
MKIVSAGYVKSALRKSGWPESQLPEIAFAGRSNVGKSSLINSVLNRKKLVKTSSSPGKTRAVNFFLINQQFMFADLPGYGFAHGDKREVAGWKRMVEEYLTQRESLKGLVHIVDIRRKPDELEEMMAEWADHSGLRRILVANKCDKLSKSACFRSAKIIEEKLGVKPVLYSVLKGAGKKELWSAIAQLLTD